MRLKHLLKIINQSAVALSIFLLCGSVHAETAQAIFYENSNFSGRSFTVTGHGTIRDLRTKFQSSANSYTGRSTNKNWNDAISSIQIIGNMKVTLYSATGLSGEKQEYTTSTRSLPASSSNSTSFNNKTSSIVWQAGVVALNQQPQVVFYDRPSFQGNSFLLNVGDEISKLRKKRRNKRSKDWDDEIRSVQIFGAASVILYADDKMRGGHVTLTQSFPSLYSENFNALASSVRVRFLEGN